MTSVDKRRRERIRRKKLERQGHVSPTPGKNARRMRAAQTRPRSKSAPADPLVRMTPRADTLGARRAARRQDRDDTPPAERVRPRGVIWLNWRWVSGGISVSLMILLYGLLMSDAFYVSSVAVGGVNYLTREEVFRFSRASQVHLFWLDEDEIKENLESEANIASAEVNIGWPNQMLQILVQERDPVITWEQGGDRVWVDINGIVMFQREDRLDLLRIVFDPEDETQDPLGRDARIDPQIVQGALLLHSRLPNIDVMLFDPINGLGWRDPRGWIAWFGVGDNMAMKAIVYEAMVDANIDTYQFQEINVSDPDNPAFSYFWIKNDG